jgi:hypothetical protein
VLVGALCAAMLTALERTCAWMAAPAWLPESDTVQAGEAATLIALLIALGVDLIVVVAFAAFVFERSRWLKRQPENSRERSECPAATSTA